MPYSVPFSDPGKSASPIVVNDLTENNTSTSLSLVGRNYSNYGVSFAKNFLHLLENFASPTAPNNSIEGQVWYNNDTKRLYVNDSTGGQNNWRPASGTHISPSTSRPTNALLGDLWVDTLTQQLNLYNGTDWVLVGPTALAGKKSGIYVESILDSSGASHFITVEYNNDNPIKITASESFIPQRAIDGFVQINPGINVSSKLFIGPTDTTVATTSAKIYGTATAADSLNVTSPSNENVSANNFARRDSSNIFYGQQIIANDAGLVIGTANNLSLTVVQGTATLKNAYDGGAIDLVVNYQGANNVIVKVDGRNKRVGINNSIPNAELDVAGDAIVSGSTLVSGTLDATTATSGALQVRGGVGVSKNLFVNKNITSNGVLRVGSIDDSGNLVAGSAIIPQQPENSTPIYDIGSATKPFRTIYATNFSGQFNGTVGSVGTPATVVGNVIGSAGSLANSTNFQLTGDLTSPTPASFNGSGGTLNITSSLADAAIKGKTEIIDSRPDDTLLVYRQNVGIRKVTRTNFLLGEAFVPIGSIFPYASSLVPLGYLLCDGALVSRTEYPYLYQVIGTTYGAGAGGNYFRLPDLRGRFPLGNVAMANALGNPTVSKQTVGVVSGDSPTSVTVTNTDNIAIGMVVTSNTVTIPTGTVVTAIPNSNTVVLSNGLAGLNANVTLTFTLYVLRDSIPVNSPDRIGNITGNTSASNIGADSGRSSINLNTISSGSGQVQSAPGAGQPVNTSFDINIVNPYLTINYIIRAGVGATQLV